MADAPVRGRQGGHSVRRAFLIAAVAVALVAGWGGRADAHALLISSDPAGGATLAHAPAQVIITFSEQPDPALSSIQVLDSTGATRAGGRPQPVPGRIATLAIAASGLPNGVYTVAWRTVSRVDGHLAAGSYSFGIGEAPTAAAATSASGAGRSPGPTVWAVIARWMFFTGLLGLVGVGFVALILPGAGSVGRRLARLGALAWAVAAIGTAGITDAQRRAARVPVGRVLSSSLGHALRLRGLPLIAAGLVAVAATLTRPWARRRWLLVAGGLGAVAAMAGEADAGHAAAATRWEWFRVATQWGHLTAVGVWIGGLAVFLACLGGLPQGTRAAAARRYSAVAAVGLAVVAATGTLRAVDEIRSWHELFATGFGQLVIVKTSLLGVLAVLGAVNRYRSVPAADGRPRLLARIGASEVAVAIVVLVATAILVNLVPPATVAAGQPARPQPPLALDAADGGTTVRAHLTISPGTAGFNQFHLSLVDYDTRQPVTPSGVALRFTLPARPDLGQSNLTLQPAGPGQYAASGANLAIDGTWTVTAVLQQADGAVEIPFTVAPRTRPQNITVARSPGLPTVYTLHLQSGLAVQVYLDPGHPGSLNEFHVTVLGADGNETATDTVTVTVTPPGGTSTSLTVRRLDPVGHFVADLLNPTVGDYRFPVTATTAQGDRLTGTFTTTVTP